MRTAEIKRRWLEFFESKDHVVVPSAPLISQDPNLMFVVAGMVPFIPYMTGIEPAPFQRATSVQKCVRTLDIDEVGKTTRHGTFFQMNGNFSFGDYFKREAIRYAWELLTTSVDKGGLGFDPNKLWATVYEGDEESIELWLEETEIPRERIQKRGMADNYWSTGQAGPAGPCSEIYFDRGPKYGIEGGPVADEDRYIEIWNLVFMQFQRGDGGTKYEFPILGELPSKNIDTGMGLERVAFLLQDVENIYEIDQIRPLIDLAAILAGKKYGANEQDDVRMRIIADHVRSSLMLMSDGVSPSNEGRGYILRRLLRRVIRAVKLLGIEEPVFEQLIRASFEAMVEAYPELRQEFPRVLKSVVAEQKAFLTTLTAGEELLQQEISNLKTKVLPAELAFKLHDTFGFPIDLTQEIAEENGLSVNRVDFDALMQQQKSRAQADARAKRTGGADTEFFSEMRALGKTEFTGYEELETEAKILGISVVGEQLAEVILDRTSLYAESGGQVADFGHLIIDGVEYEVVDVQRPVRGLISHRIKIDSEIPDPGMIAISRVNRSWRLGAAQAHSATHVVHAALRQALGPDALQSGSYNRPGYMRLDFSWNEALTSAARSDIEEISNQAIRSDLAVSASFMNLKDAREWGAIALFGETYDEDVRVIQVGGPWSRELCGGTHVSRSSQIGQVSIVSESSVGSGSRRLEAIVGIEGMRQLWQQRDLMKVLSESYKANGVELIEKIKHQQEELKLANKQLADFRMSALKAKLPELARSHTGGKLVTDLEIEHSDQLREIMLSLRGSIGDMAVIVGFAQIDGKPLVAAAVGDAMQQQFKAGDLVKVAASALGGGGGGKADFAQGGGADTAKILLAKQEIKSILGL